MTVKVLRLFCHPVHRQIDGGRPGAAFYYALTVSAIVERS